MSQNIHIPSAEEMKKKNPFFRDVWNAILEDSWMWVVAWGKPRTGKTTH